MLLIIIGVSVFVGPFSDARAEDIEHKVKPGETLQKISQQYFGTTRRWYKIWRENSDIMEWPKSLAPGMTLKFEGPLAVAAQIKSGSEGARKIASIDQTETPVMPAPPAEVVVPKKTELKPEKVTQEVAPAAAPAAAPAPQEPFEVPPPPLVLAPKNAPKFKVAVTKSAPAEQMGFINLVQIQPVTIHRQHPARGIASVPSAEEDSKIRSVRSDSFHALKVMEHHPESYEVDHIIPPGKPESSNFSKDDLQRFASIQQLDRLQMAQAAERPIEEVVNDLVKGVIDSANQIQPRRHGKETARAIASENEIKGTKVGRRNKVEMFSAIEDISDAIAVDTNTDTAKNEVAPAKRALPRHVTRQLGSQPLIGPDL